MANFVILMLLALHLNVAGVVARKVSLSGRGGLHERTFLIPRPYTFRPPITTPDAVPIVETSPPVCSGHLPVIGATVSDDLMHTEIVVVTSTSVESVFLPQPTILPEVVKTDTVIVPPVTSIYTPEPTTTDFTQSPRLESSSTSAALPTPSVCGEHGEFDLNFDGLPRFSGPSGEGGSIPPIFNPHRHFYFSTGWGYLQNVSSRYAPQSPPHVAIFVQDDEDDSPEVGSPYAGLLYEGQFGAGPRAADDTYWFNARSVWLGCNDNGIQDAICDVTVTGYKYSSTLKVEYPAETHNYQVPTCAGNQKCALEPIQFVPEMFSLTGLGFEATVLGSKVTWYVDDLELSWFNDSCAAGLKRISTR